MLIQRRKWTQKRKEPLCGESRWSSGVEDRENGEVSVVVVRALCVARENEMARKMGVIWR